MTAGAPATATTASTFAVKVLLFAVHADRVGAPEVHVELAEPASVATLRQALVRAGHGALLAGQARVAVNQRLADEGAPIRQGDEVALIPPVAGG